MHVMRRLGVWIAAGVWPLSLSAEAQTVSEPALAPVTGCGQSLPMTLANFDRFAVSRGNSDEDAYAKTRALLYGNALTELCASSPKYRALVEKTIQSIRLIRPVFGEDDPLPGSDEEIGHTKPRVKVGGRVLLVPYLGGDFDKTAFTTELTAALDAGSVIKPSYSCAKVTSRMERFICDEPDLADLDSAFGAHYSQTLARHTDLTPRLRQEQRAWLKDRESQCGGIDPSQSTESSDRLFVCLRNAYQQRNMELFVLNDTPQPIAGPVDIGAGGTYTGKAGAVTLSATKLDGSASVSLDVRTQDGSCTIKGSVQREGPSWYIFRDMDKECRIVLNSAGSTLQIETQGACLRSFCSGHSPVVDGDYIR
jgi:uncharacterized protein YecT (DUF1311 family)